MDRLSEGAVNILDELHRERLDYYREYVPLMEALEKLARYEDDEVEGRLLILPCKVGDTVYQHDGVRIYQSIITSIIITDSRLLYHTTGVGFDETAIGGSIFLTRAEAEAALKGGKQ